MKRGKNTNRTGVTLTEVIVVILIILFLLALLLPSVSCMSFAARRAECANRLKYLCVAAAYYADTFGVLPSAANGGSYTFDADGNRVYTYGQRFSTFVPLLPYLDAKETYQKIRWDQSPYQNENSQNREVMRKQLDELRCPSDLWYGNDKNNYDCGWTNYVVNTGTWCGLRRQPTPLAPLPTPKSKPVSKSEANEASETMEDDPLASHFGDINDTNDTNDTNGTNGTNDAASDETERGNGAAGRENTGRNNAGLDGEWAAEWDGVFGYDQDLWMPEYLPPIRIRACPAIRLDDITDGISNTVMLSEAIVGSDYGERHERHLDEICDPRRGDCFGGSWGRTATATDSEALMRVRSSWLSSSRQILNSDQTLRRDAPTPLWKQRGSHWSVGAMGFTWYNHILPPNAACFTPDETASPRMLAPASSGHKGGVNAAMCDGCVRFVSEKIDAELDSTSMNTFMNGRVSNMSAQKQRESVWCAIGTRAGHEEHVNF